MLTGMQGKLWIDKAEYHWVKAEVEVVKPVDYAAFIAKVVPGTRFEFELAPVEGHIWLPRRFVQIVNARILGFKSIRTEEEETYSHYRRAEE